MSNTHSLHMYYICKLYTCNTCVGYTPVSHMWNMFITSILQVINCICNTPKTLHMYYMCITHVIYMCHIWYCIVQKWSLTAFSFPLSVCNIYILTKLNHHFKLHSLFHLHIWPEIVFKAGKQRDICTFIPHRVNSKQWEWTVYHDTPTKRVYLLIVSSLLVKCECKVKIIYHKLIS